MAQELRIGFPSAASACCATRRRQRQLSWRSRPGFRSARDIEDIAMRLRQRRSSRTRRPCRRPNAAGAQRDLVDRDRRFQRKRREFQDLNQRRTRLGRWSSEPTRRSSRSSTPRSTILIIQDATFYSPRGHHRQDPGAERAQAGKWAAAPRCERGRAGRIAAALGGRLIGDPGPAHHPHRSRSRRRERPATIPPSSLPTSATARGWRRRAPVA